MFDFENEARSEAGVDIALDREELGVTREQIVEELVCALSAVLGDSFYSDERRKALIEINEYLETV